MKVTNTKEEQEELIRTESNDYEIDNETKPPWSGFLQKDEGETHISRSFDGHKEIVLVATTKPIEQGLAPQLVHKQVRRGTVVHWSAGVQRLFPSLKSECGTEPSE
ncbi:hypothetical protein HRI_005300700 [Hibiscus trionum]|uniref:Uncharacterized protein n=1 Tax=Hibiscus trionum TaxID=183268 RepID=A0A9W7MVJ7_HIBTR|nr:hypothetical protein HRI_004774300 [Hibiscus trionum]GMJ16314.1 hypothetical protein HRI_005300700 [Hibiscus trionum]